MVRLYFYGYTSEQSGHNLKVYFSKAFSPDFVYTLPECVLFSKK